MAAPVTITGSRIVLYINNKPYKEVQSISISVDYGEEEIYGIDSPYPQEIGGGKISVSGSVQGLRLKLTGGLQGASIRPLFTDVSAAPYISIRIQERETQEDILFLPFVKVTKENHSAGAGATYKVNFDFKALIPLWALDRS